MTFEKVWRAASGIPSAVTVDEAKVLWTEAVRAPERIVEIGSWKGRSSVLLAHAAKALHLIDPFDGTRGVGGTTFSPSIAAVLVHNLKARAPECWTYHPLHSSTVAKTWHDGPVSLLWVDGDHSLQGTLTDWEAWVPHLAYGARVALHDRDFPGPAAVIEAAVKSGWEIGNCAGSLVVLEPPCR